MEDESIAKHPDQTVFDFGKEFDFDMYCSIYNHGPETPEELQTQTTVDNSVTLIPGKKRSKFERWLDRHNHKMELLRTLFGFFTVGLQVVILAKLFGLL